MPQAGFELAVPANERPQSHALDRAAVGIDHTGTIPQENATGAWGWSIISSSVDSKNKGIYISTPPLCLMVWTGASLPFLVPLS
jgi:hypothetical protein